jgi:AcrR family transcriptional regulator
MRYMKRAEGPSDAEHRAAKRSYRMTARREAVEQTRGRILQAAYELWLTRPYDEVTLDAVAEAAEVSRQTVHRQFGSKDDLLVAVIEWRRPQEAAADDTVAPGDVVGAVAQHVARYERMGDALARFLQMEGRVEAVDRLLGHGRRAHRTWLERVFEEHLRPLDRHGREQTVLALYAASDVMVWKLLRRDFGCSRAETEAIIGRLMAGALHTLVHAHTLENNDSEESS